MGIRSLGYDSRALDDIICYFMRTALRYQKSGVEHLPVKNTLAEPYRGFVDTAMGVFLNAPLPELARLILDAEYDALLSRGPVSPETAMGLRLIKELTWHIHYDDACYSYLLATENIWGNTALEYATFTFYPNLPAEVRRKYHIDELIAHVPEKLFRPDDY